MKPAKPIILTIFGITGDLSNRMLLPALYHLEQDNLLPDSLRLVGTSRRQLEIESIKQKALPFIEERDGKCDHKILDKLLSRLQTIELDPAKKPHYEWLDSLLAEIETEQGMCMKRMFYLAIPPKIFDEAVTNIGQTKLDKCEHNEPGRLLIEKPFGNDLASARHLVKLLNKYFAEEQIYRIDHFLAKDTVQNILHFRFHNPIVRDIWNSRFIDHVQITVAEDIGIEDRAEFYEETGALRDMIQSHLLQLVAMVAMKEPKTLESQDIRTEREAALAALKPFTPTEAKTEVVRGQYKGYRTDVKNPKSKVETYVALKLEVDNARWSGVPIYLRTGKALERKVTEITLVYGDDEDAAIDALNQLIVRMHPNEGIALKMVAKKPGLDQETEEIIMDYCYTYANGRIKHDAYEKLLVDSMRDEQTLFPSSKEIMDSWRFVQSILNHWHNGSQTPEIYAQGSIGPASASQILIDEPIDWLELDMNICKPRFEKP